MTPPPRLCSCLRIAAAVLALAALTGGAAAAREAGDPIRLAWTEGDVAGLTNILSADGKKTIGFVEYHQHRRGDVVEMVRVAHFADGSSDEDQAEARVGDTLQALRGRSIIRDRRGKPTVDITIDVTAGRIRGFYLDGDERQTVDEAQTLPPGTYWGPLIFVVVKNFERNAVDGRVVFTTVAPTPKPRVIDMELVGRGTKTLTRPGGRLDAAELTLLPTINFLIDPIVQRIAPKTTFYLDAGHPPALARFDGPRNYAGQEMRLE